MRTPLLSAVALAAALAAAPPAMANVPLTQVSADPYTNSTSQHATEAEPDTFANGATVVGAFQVGRFFNGCATNIGFGRSGNRGGARVPPRSPARETFRAGAAARPAPPGGGPRRP